MLCFGKRSITEMKKAYILLMLLSLCACAKEPTPPMLGSDGREIPMVFQNFPDIPFPDEAFLVLEDSKTMGSGENWIGSISFTVNFNAGRVFDYYIAGNEENICLPEPKDEKRAERTETSVQGGFIIVDYSEKAIAVFGDTKPVKDALHALGGRFNARLTHDGQKKAGWIFQKTKEDEVRRLLGKDE